MRLAPGRVGERRAPDHTEILDRRDRGETEAETTCRRVLEAAFAARGDRRIWTRAELRAAVGGNAYLDRCVPTVLRRFEFTSEHYGGEQVWVRPSVQRVAHVVARHVIEVDGPLERARKAGRVAYAPMPRELAPPRPPPGTPEEDVRTSPLVVATSPRVRRCLGEVVARGLAPDLGGAAHAVLHAYALDLEDRLREEAGDVPAPADPEVAEHLRRARAQPGWLGRPAQGYAPLPPSEAVAAFWQAPGCLWRGRAAGAACGVPGAFRAVAPRGGARLLTFDGVVGAAARVYMPLEWRAWEWCPADGDGRLVGW